MVSVWRARFPIRRTGVCIANNGMMRISRFERGRTPQA
jgi:hypothetical protein